MLLKFNKNILHPFLHLLNKKPSENKRFRGFGVPRAGIEPAHPKVQDFESSASTSSATEAFCLLGLPNKWGKRLQSYNFSLIFT